MMPAALCPMPRPSLFRSLCVSALLVFAAPLSAQETTSAPAAIAALTWVQIEAQPDEATARERAAAWSAVFPDVQGYSVGRGWYAIALGPYDPVNADLRLRALKAENLIPADSFLATVPDFGPMFWPVAGPAPVDGAGTLPAPVEVTPLDTPEPTTEAAAPEDTPAPALPDETPEEARASEALLTQTEREDLQRALEWFGFYASSIDGAFGRGTRASMAAWQSAQGQEPTGILTTAQRAQLTAAWQDEIRAFGFETISEPEAGIEVTLPGALVEFDHYEPPFVHYREKDGSGVRFFLISTPGTEATLSGLYSTLQSLEIMPQTGPRELGESSFTLRGESADIVTLAEASAGRGLVKGWMLSFPAADAARMERVVTTIRASFRGTGDKALDPGMVPLSDSTRQGLLAGLEVRHARLSASGFYVDAGGAVLTSAATVAQCGRILLDGVTEATVALSDPATGLAVLKPATPLAPTAHAALSPGLPAQGAAVALAGYSYADRLSAPVLTYGRMAEVGGLDGETGINRLALSALPGDAGGPVLAADGSVFGILLPRVEGGARVLPADVSFAADAARIAAVLTAAGIRPETATGGAALPPAELTRQAVAMTVLVSCFD